MMQLINFSLAYYFISIPFSELFVGNKFQKSLFSEINEVHGDYSLAIDKLDCWCQLKQTVLNSGVDQTIAYRLVWINRRRNY